MDQNIRKLIITKYDELEYNEDVPRQKELRKEIIDLLKNNTPLESIDFYIWGLTYYMSNDQLNHHRGLALEKFLKAYALDSDNFLACLYTAHCYQDERVFEQALHYYELVNQEELKAFQVWRYVKLLEQIGACHWELGRQEMGRNYFEQVLDWYRKLPIEDRAVPSELLGCLPESDPIVLEIKKIENYL